MHELLSSFCTTSSSVLLLGDLNIHVDTPSSHSAAEFLGLLDCLNLRQIVEVPISNLQVCDLGVSDHKIISMDLPSPYSKPQCCIHFRNLKNINPTDLNSDIKSLSIVPHFSSVSESVNYYNNGLLEDHAPVKIMCGHFFKICPVVYK
ncbi:uncharacterized protein LOC106525272 [Lates japonicus]